MTKNWVRSIKGWNNEIKLGYSTLEPDEDTLDLRMQEAQDAHMADMLCATEYEDDPDPPCDCGDAKSMHKDGKGSCSACDCKEFELFDESDYIEPREICRQPYDPFRYE